MLQDIHTSIYDNGAYPAGNTQVLTLLQNGSVSLITAWSDQALLALAKGVAAPNRQAGPAHRLTVPWRFHSSIDPQKRQKLARRAGLPQFHVEQ